MARPRRRTEIDDRIGELVRTYVNQLVSAISMEVRRNLGEELQSYFAGGNGVAPRGRGGRGLLRRPRRMDCIAPGCKNQSKGPRFHYLCDDHLNASKKDVEAWRKARKAEAKKAA